MMLYLPLTGEEALIYSVAVLVSLSAALLLVPAQEMQAATESR